MNCTKCHSYVSGNVCKNCNEVLIEKRKPVTIIKKVSDKKKLQDVVYSAKRIKFLKDNPKCEVFKHLSSIEIHHDSGRHGSNYLDESTWHAVSREGHNWIHSNDSEAREKGFLKTRTT